MGRPANKVGWPTAQVCWLVKERGREIVGFCGNEEKRREMGKEKKRKRKIKEEIFFFFLNLTEGKIGIYKKYEQ